MPGMQTKDLSGKRFASGAIDYLIIFAFSFLYILLFGEPNEEGGKTVSGWPALVPMVFWVCWLVLPEVIWGTTFGHVANGLKIISTTGEKPSFSQALKRRLCDAIEISWCFGLIAFILIKNTKLHQRLGDIWANTLVVNKDYQVQPDNFEFEQEKQLQH